MTIKANSAVNLSLQDYRLVSSQMAKFKAALKEYVN